MKFNNEKHVKNLFEINDWTLERNTLYSTKSESLICESLTSLGNAFFGSRGNFEETYSGIHHQGSYNAGVWFPDATKVGWWKNGYPLYFGKAINSLNFLPIKVFVNGVELDLNVFKPKQFKQELNMQFGILSRDFIVDVNGISLKCHTQRFYSIHDHELAFIKYQVTPNQNCDLKFVSMLDGDVHNLDANYNEQFWQPFDSGVDNHYIYTGIKTKPNPYGVDQFTVFAAAKNFCSTNQSKKEYQSLSSSETFEAHINAHQTFQINKVVAVLTTRHHHENDLKQKAIQKIFEIHASDLEKHEQLHKNAWLKRWKTADVIIEGDRKAQQGIRFSLFQLFSTYYGEDQNFNIGPKGFTGEKYGGATYWDTEAYCLPVYLSTSESRVAKNLLMYRYNQLKQAKHNAKQQGLDGALYPMVTFNGIECHNEWEITFEEIHRNGIVAYAIYQYTNYTKDESYIQKYGIEVLIEIAKFFASRVHYCQNKKAYMIHGVTGPNEFENNVNNNWYTNKLAKWVLEYTLKNLKKYKINLKKYKLDEKILNNWKNIAKNIYFNYDEKLKIFVQHDTFLDKEFIEVKDLSSKDRPIVHNWSWDKILRSCFIKQADVLQGIYLFQEHFSEKQIRDNYEFYIKYTVHESSLSPCIHAILAARLNKIDDAYNLYQRASRLDLDNYNDDTKDGLHITSMAGSWMSIIEGFGGMRVIDSKLHFNPKLPKKWKSLTFHVVFQQRQIKISIKKNHIDITLLSGEPIDLFIEQKRLNLKNHLSLKI